MAEDTNNQTQEAQVIDSGAAEGDGLEGLYSSEGDATPKETPAAEAVEETTETTEATPEADTVEGDAAAEEPAADEGGKTNDPEKLARFKERQQVQQEVANATKPLTEEIASLKQMVKELAEAKAPAGEKPTTQQKDTAQQAADIADDLETLEADLAKLDDDGVVEPAVFKKAQKAIHGQMRKLGDQLKQLIETQQQAGQEREALSAADAYWKQWDTDNAALAPQRTTLVKASHDRVRSTYKHLKPGTDAYDAAVDVMFDVVVAEAKAKVKPGAVTPRPAAAAPGAKPPTSAPKPPSGATFEKQGAQAKPPVSEPDPDDESSWLKGLHSDEDR